MRISHRVRQMERLDAFAHPPSVLERLQRVPDQSSGNRIPNAAEDELISANLQAAFLEKLSDKDLVSLISDLERITARSAAPGSCA